MWLFQRSSEMFCFREKPTCYLRQFQRQRSWKQVGMSLIGTLKLTMTQSRRFNRSNRCSDICCTRADRRYRIKRGYLWGRPQGKQLTSKSILHSARHTRDTVRCLTRQLLLDNNSVCRVVFISLHLSAFHVAFMKRLFTVISQHITWPR